MFIRVLQKDMLQVDYSGVIGVVELENIHTIPQLKKSQEYKHIYIA